jgi:polysaccharide pyruvyl transferase WcaK-like protein
MRPGNSSTPGQDDDIFANEILSRVSHPDHVILMPISFTPAEIKYCMRYFNLMVGVRMHATILALGSTTPCINIYYNEKGASLFKSLNLEEYAISIDSCHPELIIDSMKKIWPKIDVVRDQISEKIKTLKEDAQKPYEILSSKMLKH